MPTHITTASLTIAALTLAPMALNAATAEAATTKELVAMGDSWAAGTLAGAPDNTAPALCLRSATNNGHLMAAQYGMQLTDVTCGGAQTKDFTSGQYSWTPPQLDAVTADTDYVSINIGGNDNNTFVSAVAACLSAAPLTLYQGSPCKTIYGSKFANDIRTKTYPQVGGALRAVHAKAPTAKVAILGSQNALPAVPTAACQAKTLLAKGDFAYVNDIQATINSVIKQAATDTGSIYVDMPAISAGHDSCAGSAAWVSPLGDPGNLAPVHPTSAGNAAMAAATARAFGLS